MILKYNIISLLKYNIISSKYNTSLPFSPFQFSITIYKKNKKIKKKKEKANKEKENQYIRKEWITMVIVVHIGTNVN